MVRSGICSVCGCFRSDLRQHMDSHSGQSFQCHICGRAYPRRKTLNQHIKRSHPSLIPDTNGVPIQQPGSERKHRSIAEEEPAHCSKICLLCRKYVGYDGALFVQLLEQQVSNRLQLINNHILIQKHIYGDREFLLAISVLRPVKKGLVILSM